MTAKREIYARIGVQLRGNRRAFKAERLAPGAMGLYAFMLMDARAELPEVDGFVSEEVVLSAWGRPVTERLAQVEALCTVDLVERAPGGFVVVKYDEHNDCRQTVEKNRKITRLRVAKHRKDVTRYMPVTEGVCNGDVPISSSISNSLSESGSQIASTPPPWFGTVLDVIEMNVGERLHAGTAWLRYRGHRSKKGEPMSQHDAEYWLTTVMVKEAKADREEAHRRNARDGERTQAFVQQRSGPEIKAQDSRKQFRERDEWERTAGPPDPETAARMRALLGKVGT